MYTNEQPIPLALMPPSNQEPSTELMPYIPNDETTNPSPVATQTQPQPNNLLVNQQQQQQQPILPQQPFLQQSKNSILSRLPFFQKSPQPIPSSPMPPSDQEPSTELMSYIPNDETANPSPVATQTQPQPNNLLVNQQQQQPVYPQQSFLQQSKKSILSLLSFFQKMPKPVPLSLRPISDKEPSKELMPYVTNNETTNPSPVATQTQQQQQQIYPQQSSLQQPKNSILSRLPFFQKSPQPTLPQQQVSAVNDEKNDENNNNNENDNENIEITPMTVKSNLNENLEKDDQLEKYSSVITNFFIQKPDLDQDQQLNLFTYMSEILPDEPNPKIIEKWNADHLNESRNIKDRLYNIVESMTNENEQILKCIAKSIGKFSLIEYQKNFWQQDFDYILDQLLAIKNTENSIPEPTVYIYLKVIYLMLSNGIPKINDPFYDEKVSNIVEVLNIYLNQEDESFKYPNEIKEIVLKNIKESLKIFKRYFNNIINFKAQLDHLMSLIDMVDPEKNRNFFELIYDCFYLSIMNYYEISHSIMRDLFMITLSHLRDELKFVYALKFWSIVAKTEKEIDLETSKYYILGFINSPENIIEKDLLPLTKFASPEIFDINEPEDDELNIELITIECIQSIFKAETESMFKILSQYFNEYYKNRQPKNRLSALIIYFCIINSFENEDDNQIVNFIKKTLPVIIGFAQESNAKLRYYALNIIKIVMTKFPSFITNNRDRINDIFSILLKKKAQPSILLEIYDTFTLMFKSISPSNLDLIENNFDDLYSFISKSYPKDSNDKIVNAATKYSKALIKKAPDECDQLIFKKLDEYVSVDEPSNEFSNKDKIQLYLLPVFMEKLQKNPDQKKLTNDYILKIVNKILELFISNKMMYNEILEAIVKIIPFTKQISFSKFGKELINNLIENHKSDDSVTKKSTCYAFVALLENFSNEMQYYIKEILDLVMNDLKSETLIQRAYPPIFYLAGSIVKEGIFSDVKYSNYSKYFINCIKLKVSSFSFKKEDFDQELFDLCFEILTCYLALLDAFKFDDEKFNILEKQTILFIKKLEINDFCYNDLLESSIKIIFIILCKKKIDSFQILSQPILNRIIVRGSEYEDDEDIRSVSIKILNIFTNHC